MVTRLYRRIFRFEDDSKGAAKSSYEKVDRCREFLLLFPSGFFWFSQAASVANDFRLVPVGYSIRLRLCESPGLRNLPFVSLCAYPGRSAGTTGPFLGLSKSCRVCTGQGHQTLPQLNERAIQRWLLLRTMKLSESCSVACALVASLGSAGAAKADDFKTVSARGGHFRSLGQSLWP